MSIDKKLAQRIAIGLVVSLVSPYCVWVAIAITDLQMRISVMENTAVTIKETAELREVRTQILEVMVNTIRVDVAFIRGRLEGDHRDVRSGTQSNQDVRPQSPLVLRNADRPAADRRHRGL